MKLLSLLLVLCLLSGCASGQVTTVEPTPDATVPTQQIPETTSPETVFASRFDTTTEIQLSDSGITVDGGEETSAVFTSQDIIYYEDRTSYESGNPYGEGEDWQRHSAQEAAAHTVVNITAPGAYRLTGKLSAGQIRINLGENAYDDPDAVVELILCDADITCTVAPAILFQNVYECDGNWSVDTAKADVDTASAGANLILEGKNTVNGSHVAKIFKDKDGEKKLWKQDGAIYSYMSMNVEGPGSLALSADNEGLDSELHLTLNGGDITICSGNDGINTNEDGVSVTTINGGSLTIFAGLDKEGDGIDSNGYLVINGGTVVSAAHPAADAGLDSDLGSFIHGGTVIALGSTMDWAESESRQVTMNLQFASQQKAGSKITITREDGTEICSFKNNGQHSRTFSGLILSHPGLAQGQTYHVYVDGVQMAYTGTDVRRGPGGFGGGMPPQWENGERPEMPEGMEFPEGMTPPEGMEFPEGMTPPEGMEFPEGMTPPDGMEFREDRKRPEGMEFPEGMTPPEGMDKPQGNFPGPMSGNREPAGEASTEFYMNDMVNAFSGVTKADG